MANYFIIIWMEKLDLKVKDLYLKYFGGYLGVDMVSFETNESIAVFGKTMSGKTSLLRCIAGLEKYDGVVETNAKDIVFTFDLDSLKVKKTVKENIAYPLILRNETNVDDQVLSIAKRFGIDSIIDNPIAKLSKEQKRLVILARAFVRDADLYLLDDPLKDVEDREKYFQIILDLIKDKNVIYATTKKEEALSFNKMLCMAYKKAVGFGTAKEILSFPKSINVLKLLEDYEYVNVELKKSEDKYNIEYENNTYDVIAPISDIYVNKEVVFPLDKDKLVLNTYFDKATEYLISRI